MNYVNFGTYIKNLRHLYGKTRKEVSQSTGLSLETIRRAEEGIPEVKNSTLEILSNYYKVNLIKILSHYYDESSFHSVDIVKTFSPLYHCIQENELTSALLNIRGTFKQLENDSNASIRQIIDVLGKLQLAEAKDSKISIIVLEDLLLMLSQNHETFLDAPKIYELEYLVASILATFYRRDGQTDKAITLCIKAIDKLKDDTVNDYSNNRFLGAFYFNLCYAYHKQDRHLDIVHTANEVLTLPDLLLSKATLSAIYYRLALAEHSLNQPQWRQTLTTALVLASPTTKVYLLDQLKRKNIPYPPL